MHSIFHFFHLQDQDASKDLVKSSKIVNRNWWICIYFRWEYFDCLLSPSIHHRSFFPSSASNIMKEPTKKSFGEKWCPFKIIFPFIPSLSLERNLHFFALIFEFTFLVFLSRFIFLLLSSWWWIKRTFLIGFGFGFVFVWLMILLWYIMVMEC